MTRKVDVDALIREAMQADAGDELDRLGEPGLPEMVADLFRGRLRAYVVIFLFMMLACTALAIYSGYRFFATSEVVEMLHWGAGFFVGLFVALNAKNWYWMQMERLATSREIKRVELLVAQLAAELRDRQSGPAQ